MITSELTNKNILLVILLFSAVRGEKKLFSVSKQLCKYLNYEGKQIFCFLYVLVTLGPRLMGLKNTKVFFKRL